MKIRLIIIGDEILNGKIIDKNSNFLINELKKINFYVDNIIIVHDEYEKLFQILSESINNYDLIITTGGLGPTNDDITLNVLSKVTDFDILEDDTKWNEYISRLEMDDIVKRLGNFIPKKFIKNSELLSNPLGTAPGVFLKKENSFIACLPGVPREVKAISPYLLKKLENIFNMEKWETEIIRTINTRESLIYEDLKDLIEKYQDKVKFAFYPVLYGVDLVIRYKMKDKNIADYFIETIKNKYSTYIYSFNENDLVTILKEKLIENNFKLAVAESCTGGLISKLITDIPGSSKYFLGGFTVYSNESKINLLNVKESTLANFGAVSYECIREMLDGIIKKFPCNTAIAVSGIAGPDGGSAEKPVGTVFIGVKCNDNENIEKFLFTGDREMIRLKSAYMGIFMLIKEIEKK